MPGLRVASTAGAGWTVETVELERALVRWGIVLPGTASAGMARSSIGSRRGSDTCIPPGCTDTYQAHR